MNDDSRAPGARSRAGHEAGRAASAEELRRRLPSAPPSFLEGALENPGLGEEELLLLLRNRQATPALLSRIGGEPRWSRSYEVRRGLVRNPRTPPALAARLARNLFWKDLLDAAEDNRVHATVRRKVEQLLEARVSELSEGERISLARRAGRSIIPRLIESSEDRVLRSLLDNRRLVEFDAVQLASAVVPAEFLAALADHERWGGNRAVRIALLQNGRTPVPVSLKLLGRLHLRDLRRVAKDGKVPTIVRVGATRELERSAPLEAN